MAGYLDNYGAGEEQREKLIKRVVIVLVAVIVVGGVAFFFLKNYRQEKQVKTFFDLLEKKDYRAAYRLWGCTDEKPCRDYSFDRFMEDWGPNGAHSRPNSYRVTKSRSCGSGVILTVDMGDGQQEKLWVERNDLTIGFSPWPGCPPGR